MPSIRPFPISEPHIIAPNATMRKRHHLPKPNFAFLGGSDGHSERTISKNGSAKRYSESGESRFLKRVDEANSSFIIRAISCMAIAATVVTTVKSANPVPILEKLRLSDLKSRAVIRSSKL